MNLAHLRALAEAATPGPLFVTRYDHGGGRIYKSEPRTLVADLFQEGDREFYAALNPQTVLAILRIVEAAEAYIAAEQTISTWIEDGCGPVDVNYIRDAGDKRDAIAEALSDFRADPKATGMDGQGVAPLTTERLAEIIEGCDLGDSNNRPGLHAHDECYTLSPATSKRLAGQISAALGQGGGK